MIFWDVWMWYERRVIWYNDENTALFQVEKYSHLENTIHSLLCWRFIDAWIFVLVRVTVSYPEVVEMIVETLQGVFTKGVCSSTLSWPWQLRGWCRTKDYFLTPYAWGTTRPATTSQIWSHSNGPSAEFRTPAGTKGNDLTPKQWAQRRPAANTGIWWMLSFWSV